MARHTFAHTDTCMLTGNSHTYIKISVYLLGWLKQIVTVFGQRWEIIHFYCRNVCTYFCNLLKLQE